ncbi:hypothetical protein HanRHA438_Chr05g0203961 [Helianthus annuus]|nr:hypothetical protein HanRHA438_Chr05g0203961 [Helianthus annuus]
MASKQASRWQKRKEETSGRIGESLKPVVLRVHEFSETPLSKYT